MIDILMITYNRPDYTRLSLKKLLDTCSANMKVWLWHNGQDQVTLDVVESFKHHPKVFKYHHSLENVKLREPTNWFWENSTADYLSKVDDDCIVPDGWAETLLKAHEDNPNFGVIGCWHFLEEDFNYTIAKKKIFEFNNNHQLMRNCWLGGSGYLMKRECFTQNGILKNNEGFSSYCIRLASKGYINGWYYPFLYQDHMDDPRSPNTCLKIDADIEKWMPLSAKNNGVDSIREWLAQLKRSAQLLQIVSFEVREHTGIRKKIKNLKIKLKKLVGDKHQW